MSNSIKTGSARPEYTDNRPHASRSPDGPLPEAKENFEKAMSEKRKGGPDENGNSDRENGQNGQAMPSAASLMSSLFEGKMSAVAAAPPAAPNLDELVDDLVQRIFVSAPKSGTPTEIRLQLNASILPDTEIVMQRGQDGLLSVLLATGNASSMQTLVSAQQSLREQLEKHGPVDVRVNSAEESRQGDNDANRRSQGLVEYGPENL
jgi:type III secretion system needle length determinant